MKKIVKLIIVFAFFIQFAKAQEPFTHNLYSNTPFLINPAATGDQGVLSAFLDAYNQWNDFSQAPKVYTLGVHSPVYNKMAIGLNLFNDKRSYLNHLNAMFNYAYRLDLSNDQQLSFGIALGIVNNKVDFGNIYVNDKTDPLYTNNPYNATKLAAGAGAYYRFKALQLHFSLPQLLENGKNFAAQYNLIGMYDIKANEQTVIRPSVLVRAFPGNIMQTDANVMAEFKKMLWLQAGYRTDQSLLASIGISYKGFGIGYCYQAHMGDVKNIGKATHEIMLSFNFIKSQPKEVVKEEKKVIVDPNKDKINVTARLIDEKYKTPVEGKIILKQNGVEKFVGNSDKKGDCSLFVDPGAYEVEITAKGYFPISDDLDLRNVAVNTKYVYELKNGITKLEKGVVFNLTGVNFEFAKDVLLPESKRILDNASKVLLDYPNMVVEIAGHTDNVGDDASNQTLSDKRATSVVNYLKTKGIKESQMKAKGYGEAKPIATNDTPEGRLKNRRVEFIILEF